MPISVSPKDVDIDLSKISCGMKLLDILDLFNFLEEEVLVIDLNRDRLVMGNERFKEDSNWKIMCVVSRG